MKKIILAVAAIGIVFATFTANANPEADRTKLINYFEKKYPDVKLSNYVNGALAFDSDAMSQYNSIMDFPPFLDVIDQGKKMWDTPFKNGKTYAECMPNGGKMIAGNYPMYDEKLGKVVTFENLLNDCRVKNGEKPYSYSDMKTMGVLVAYARTLSDGMKMNIKVDSPGALKAFDAGKTTYYKRTGQLNFSCASCHVEIAGTVRLRSELVSPVVGQAVHWPVFRGGSRLFTLQQRFVGCFKQVRQVPDKPGSTRFNDLEYFIAYLSNGLPLHADVFRK